MSHQKKSGYLVEHAHQENYIARKKSTLLIYTTTWLTLKEFYQ
jgi:hypothetical protein